MKTIEDAVRELGGVWSSNCSRDKYLDRDTNGIYTTTPDRAKNHICTRTQFEECAKKLRNEPSFRDNEQ